MVHTYLRSVEELHQFFVDWYNGTLDNSEIHVLKSALSTNFVKINPDGARIGRDQIVTGVSSDYGKFEPGDFQIDIRNVNEIVKSGKVSVIQYEEWQYEGDVETGRITSAVLFESDAGIAGYKWRYVQDTMLK